MKPETLGFHPVIGVPALVYGELSLHRFATGLLGVFFAVALGKRGGRTIVFSLGCFKLLPQILIFTFQLVGGLEICRERC